MPAFFGKTHIDPEWVKEFCIQKEKWQQKLTAIQVIPETEIISSEIRESNTTVPTDQETWAIGLNNTSMSLSAANKQTAKEKIIGKINNSFFFKKAKKDSETIYLKSFNTVINKSC